MAVNQTYLLNLQPAHQPEEGGNSVKRVIIVLCVAGILLALLGTTPGAARPTLDDVKEKYEPNLIAIQGVSAIASDKARNEIVVFVENKQICDKIPKVLDGITVRCAETGRIEALQSAATAEPPTSQSAVPYASSYSRSVTNKPVFGGISVGNAANPSAAGTIALVTSSGQVLSCAHVLAMDGNANFVSNTAAWQPGGYNGGTAADAIGTLTRYTPIVFNNDFASNRVDAAYATLSKGIGYTPHAVLNAANNGFDTISGTGTVAPGDTVYTSGMITGVTASQVIATNGSVKIWYTQTKYAVFQDQILINNQAQFAAAGDSGAAVYKDGKFVGLVFAGSGNLTVANKAAYVTAGLGIQI